MFFNFGSLSLYFFFNFSPYKYELTRKWKKWNLKKTKKTKNLQKLKLKKYKLTSTKNKQKNYINQNYKGGKLHE